MVGQANLMMAVSIGCGGTVCGSGRPPRLEFAEQRTVEQKAAWTNRTLETFIGSPEYLPTHICMRTLLRLKKQSQDRDVKLSLKFIQRSE